MQGVLDRRQHATNHRALSLSENTDEAMQNDTEDARLVQRWVLALQKHEARGYNILAQVLRQC